MRPKHPNCIGLAVRQYKGEKSFQENVMWVPISSGRHQLRQGESLLEVAVEINSKGPTLDLGLEWRVLVGPLRQAAVGIKMEAASWSNAVFPWMAGAVYNGNRFTVRRQKYSPRYPEEDTGVHAEAVITDIPHLEKGDETPSRIQLLTGDLSAPAIGYVDPLGRTGLYLSSDIIDTSDLFEIEETADRSGANFTVLRGGVREGRYSWLEMVSDAPSGDRAPDLRKGEKIRQQFHLSFLQDASIQSLFDRHFDWMMAGKDLPRNRIVLQAPSLSTSFQLVETKYNRDNWDEENELYSTTCDPDSPYYYQTGWCGGGIADSALLCGRDHLTRRRAERALNRLCRDGQLSSGFFYGKRNRDGAWLHDYEDDSSRPYTHRWHLVRREGDLLLFLLKAANRTGLDAAKDSVELWKASAKELADTVCRLWEAYGQLGQFIDAETAAILVGGSSSGAVFPAGLCLMYRENGDRKYLSTAEKIAVFFYENFTRIGLSTGGPGDACQAPDSESCAGLLESYVTLYEETRGEFWLEAAKAQAAQFASWVMPYDFPFPPESEFGRLGIPTTGSVFANAQNKHAAPGICTHSGDSLRRLSTHTDDARYEQLLRWMASQITWTVSREDQLIRDPTGKSMPSGWINERVNTSDWDDNVGGIFYGSTWAEVALMLMAVEVGDG